MSVQAGLWNFDGKPVEQEVLTKISESLAQYGPDGEKTYLNGEMGMLYRPFHTTSESKLDYQPYCFADRKVIMWDGRLDNRDELVSLLLNHLKSNHTDVDIAAAAFERWGTDCFAKLIGDWALTIWNAQEKRLFLARDYMGIRHLFFYQRGERMMWCNRLEGLALCGDQFTLCDDYIAGYFAFHPDAHLTPYREIRSVPPGQFVQIHDGKTTVHSYWTFNTRLKTRYRTDAEYEEHYRWLFRQSLRRRLRTDSPILAELSGGLDSSSIVCMADDILLKEGAETPKVDTFSYYDFNEPGEDDFLHLTKIEEKRGRKGFHVNLKGAAIHFLSRHTVRCRASGVERRLKQHCPILSQVVSIGLCFPALAGMK